MKQYLLLFLLLHFDMHLFAQQEIKLENTCNEKADSILFTDAMNFFRITNWPGKAQMRLECNSCEIEFKNTGGVFSLTPSGNVNDTLEVYLDEKLLKKFVLSKRPADNLAVHLKSGKNKTVSREDLNSQNLLVVKAGNPGCRTDWNITSYDIVLPAGIRVTCNGNTLSEEAIAKLQSLEGGMQFKIENANAELKDQKIKLPDATYFFRD